MNDVQQEHFDRQEEQQLTAAQQQEALRAAAEYRSETVHNEDFLNELRKADLGDEQIDWLSDKYPAWFSGAHAVTNRGDDWDLSSDLIMQNKRERALAEQRPGRLLRDRPFLLATMQGKESPQLDAYDQPGIPGDRRYWLEQIGPDTTTVDKPATSQDQRRIFNAAEVAADLMTLSRNGAGLESVSTVKTETNVRRSEEEESTASRVGRVLE